MSESGSFPAPRRGDSSVLADEVAAFAPQLLRDARNLFGIRADDAPDVTQATLLTGLAKLESYDPSRPLLPWLRGIMRVHAARHFEGRRRPRWVPFDDVEAVAFDEPVDSAHRAGLLEALRAATDALDAPYGEVVRRHLWDTETADSIAQALGRSASTIRTQIQRGLAKLRAKLPTTLRDALVILIAVRGVDAASAPPTHRPRPTGSWAIGLIAVALLVGLGFWLRIREQSTPPITPASEQRTVTANSPPLDNRSAQRDPGSSAGDRDAPPRTGTAEVVLLDPLGRTVPGASIRLNPNHESAGSFVHVGLGHWLTAVTDAQGRARFDGLRPVSHKVHLDDGKGLAQPLLIEPGQTASRTIRAAGVRTIVGEVVDANDRPVAGAEVRCATIATVTPGWLAARSSNDGRFEFPWIRTEERGAVLYAIAPGHAASRPVELRFAAPNPRLILQSPACAVSGRVEAATAGTLVALLYVEPKDQVPRYQKTRPDGSFAFEACVAGKARLIAAAPGRRHASEEILIAPQSTASHELRLGPGAVIAGRVTDLHGVRIDNLRVAVLPGGTRPATMHALAAWAKLDEDGRFECPCDSGPVTVHLVDGGPVASRKFDLAPGERRLWDPALPRGPQLEGRVLGPYSNRVRIGYRTDAPGTTLDARETAVVDVAADGTFRLPVPLAKASYRVLAFWRAEQPGATACAEVRDARPGSAIELRIPDRNGPPVRVTGRLRGPDGKAWTGRPPQIHDDEHRIFHEGFLGSDGSFAFGAVTPGRHWLSLPESGDQPARLLGALTVPAGTGTHHLGDLDVPPTVRTRITFRHRNHAPPGPFRAVLHERTSKLRTSFMTTPLANPPLALTLDLAPGHYELAIQGRDALESRHRLEVPTGVSTCDRTIDVERAQSCILTFVYRSPTRFGPVPRVALTVQALDEPTAPLHRLVGAPPTNHPHRVELGLHPGRYRLEATAFWGATGQRTITIDDSGAVQQFDLALR